MANWCFSTLGSWSITHYLGLVSKCFLNDLLVLPSTHHPHNHHPFPQKDTHEHVVVLVSSSSFPQKTLQSLDLVISSLPSAFDKCQYRARRDLSLIHFSRHFSMPLCLFLKRYPMHLPVSLLSAMALHLSFCPVIGNKRWRPGEPVSLLIYFSALLFIIAGGQKARSMTDSRCRNIFLRT